MAQLVHVCTYFHVCRSTRSSCTKYLQNNTIRNATPSSLLFFFFRISSFHYFFLLSLHFTSKQCLRRHQSFFLSPVVLRNLFTFAGNDILDTKTILYSHFNEATIQLTRGSGETSADQFIFVGEIRVARCTRIQFQAIDMVEEESPHFVVLTFFSRFSSRSV